MPSIRTATEQDAEGLATLLRELALFSALEGQPAEAVAQGVQAQLKASLASPSHTIIVAEQGAEGDAQQGCSQGSKLVGYAAVHWLPHLFHRGPDGYLSQLFVAQDVRGRGIGRALLVRVVAEAEARGSPRLQLINFRNRDSYARRFYAKQGWTEQPEAARFVLQLTPGHS